MTITSLERRLARIDGGGDHGRVEDMSDAQLARIIRRGLPPAERAAYDSGTAAERKVILDTFVESLSQGDAKLQQASPKPESIN